MNYDFYAEFYDYLQNENLFSDYAEKKWEIIKKNKNIEWKKKVNSFVKELNNDKLRYPQIVNEYLLGKSGICETIYQKLQLLFKQYNIDTIEASKEFIEKLLENKEKGIKDYTKYKDIIQRLDLSENPKQAYKDFFNEFIVNSIIINLMSDLALYSPQININQLPSHSFFLSIEFTLKKPFISRDDEDFYIIDNPISKEKVFKIPYMRASSWKGNLRWVARKILEKDKKNTGIEKRLFGNKKEEENEFKRGRLQFYPTFFDKIGLDIINPHNREIKAGTVPIYFEIVPDKTKGKFSLLYVPFDLIGEDKSTVMKEVRNDFDIIIESIYQLLIYYGFSAKKSSGYGVIDINEKFTFNIIDKKIGYLKLRNTSGHFTKFEKLLKEIGGMNND